ncbi:MAG: DUF1566 domain-containing protein [Leptospira sp.]|nr:DUF1566 domain-containing protein [Leptospira sp.]
MKKFIILISIWELVSCKINQPDNLVFALDLFRENHQEQCGIFFRDFQFDASVNNLTRNYLPTTTLTTSTEEISIKLPYGSLTRAVPSYEIEGEGSVYVTGVEQESGVSNYDFSEPKDFELVSGVNNSCRKILQVSVQPISPVVDTGVRECYDQSVPLPDNPTSCSDESNSLRQDGVWTDVPNARAWSPAEQITTNEGIVRDRLTGLVWRKCPRGQTSADNCSGTAHLDSYEDAERYCSVELNNFDDGKGYGGFKNWRLPTVHELSSIINRSLSHTNGLVDSDIFPNSPGDHSTTDGYWTINEDASDSNYAWRIHFEYNSSNSLYNHIQTRIKSGLRRVRCVSSQLPPNKSMEKRGEAIIRDNLTGLDWDQCAFEQSFSSNVCTGSGTRLNWIDALSACQKKGTDWRLPNINELMNLYDFNRNNPGVDTTLFNDQPTASSAYWSSTTNPVRVEEAFYQEFNGVVEVRSKVAEFLVRCVRNSVN